MWNTRAQHRFPHQRQKWRSSCKGGAPLLSLEFSPSPLNSRLFSFDSLAPPFPKVRGGPQSIPQQTLMASTSLTLGFDIIHHRARGLHDHITWPGASSCIVHAPQGEPGRERRASTERTHGVLADNQALPGWTGFPQLLSPPSHALTTITQVIKYAVQSLLLLPGGSWAVICCLEDTA